MGRRRRICGANGVDGVAAIGAAAASVSTSASSWLGAASAAVCDRFAASAAAGAFFGGTSFTVTVFTLTGVSGALEPGEIAAVTSRASAAPSETGAGSADAS